MKALLNTNNNGRILYQGASLLDGKPIVVIATGYTDKSSNSKTGAMIQTWIMRSDIEPHTAVKTGDDASVCGDCPLRGVNGIGRSCYVTLHQAPLSVFRAFKRGAYAEASLNEIKELSTNKMVRLGSYGDPAAVPVHIWKLYTSEAKGWTGYTHQWQRSKDLQALCMASADTSELRDKAVSDGWRTFRVKTAEMPVMPNESVCPATTVGLDCATCGACKGSSSGNKGTIVIDVHGGSAALSNGKKTLTSMASTIQ